MRRSLIVVALLAITPMAGAQQIYKWTDAHGTVHYSQSAPAQGNYQQVKLASGVETPAAPAVKPVANDGENRAPPAPTAAQMADTPNNRAKLCATLKSNIATLQGNGPVVMQQGAKPALLDATQRQQQIAHATAQYQQFCNTK
ncbi:MAG: DUF4124 domain-containing protein [Rhodanobacter sp.]|nr:MAG: DUF4124 domain-containing protein [Rhodanobacter sp.]TAM13539.1 MAG: DUF4124 domain-containing protein [Rhodanobacter sp.]TAM35708.1 MAG: DUF4124 domain-containing protein [Rhodanobacter sp.]